jgi:hypothetical protein
VYRDAQASDLCVECRELADDGPPCPRCDGPLCAAHRPADDAHRCPPCERVYQRRTRTLQHQAVSATAEAAAQRRRRQRPRWSDHRSAAYQPADVRRVLATIGALLTGVILLAVIHDGGLWARLIAGALLAALAAGVWRAQATQLQRARRSFLRERGVHDLAPAPAEAALLPPLYDNGDTPPDGEAGDRDETAAPPNGDPAS